MIQIDTDENVYPPSDDSILLLKAIDKSRGEVLDMCAGTGIIGLNAALSANKVTLVDIDDNAIELIKHNSEINRISNVEIIKSNLFENLGDRKFDVIFVNPPYLPGKVNNSDFMDLATIGGESGEEMTIKLIEGIKEHMKESGEAFIVVSTSSNIDKVFEKIKQENLKYEVINSKSFFFEELKLIRVYRE